MYLSDVFVAPHLKPCVLLFRLCSLNWDMTDRNNFDSKSNCLELPIRLSCLITSCFRCLWELC